MEQVYYANPIIKIDSLNLHEENLKEYKISFIKAFSSHKKAAKCLFDNELYRDSYLSLIISSECLLKGIFDCLKFKLFGVEKEKNQSRIIIESYITQEK